MAKITLTSDLRQDAPLGWLVTCPRDCPPDYLLFDDRRDAEVRAEDYAASEGKDFWPIYPLYAGQAVNV